MAGRLAQGAERRIEEVLPRSLPTKTAGASLEAGARDRGYEAAPARDQPRMPWEARAGPPGLPLPGSYRWYGGTRLEAFRDADGFRVRQGHGGLWNGVSWALSEPKRRHSIVDAR